MLRRTLAVLASLLVGAATLVAVPTAGAGRAQLQGPVPVRPALDLQPPLGRGPPRARLRPRRRRHHEGHPGPGLGGRVRPPGTRSRAAPATTSPSTTAAAGRPTTSTCPRTPSPAARTVAQGQQIGVTGSTGNSSGPHIHYEQLLNGVGQNIVINGAGLAYPGSYNQYYLTSDNGCGRRRRYAVHDLGLRHPGPLRRPRSPLRSSPRLPGPTQVRVLCQKQGDTVNAEGYTNNWWSQAARPERLHDQHLHRPSRSAAARRTDLLNGVVASDPCASEEASAVGLTSSDATVQAVCRVRPYAPRISLTGWNQVSPPLEQLPQPPDVTPWAWSPVMNEPPESPPSAQTLVLVAP